MSCVHLLLIYSYCCICNHTAISNC